jgi:4-cresol dehydrogenase (hydroxylating) flavoprotein subunit
VQQCLRIANRFKVAVFPVSTGKNWGYGSRVPISDGCVLMELARLNRIVDFDEKLAYITVEPGVTFRQLQNYLVQKKSKLFIAFTGSTVDSSIVGNTMERGVGTGPKGDRFANACGFEVVLPTGECIHTGFESFRNARVARVARWGLGPHLDGMFTQSNFGVVTRMTVWLTPMADFQQFASFQLKDDHQLESFLDMMQQLILKGVHASTFTIWNVYRVLSVAGQYPWKEARKRTPLPKKFVRAAQKRFGAWRGALWLNSFSSEHARAQRKLIREALRGKADKLQFQRVKTVAMDLTDRTILQTYWRKRTPPPPHDLDPDRDRCGVIWFSPAIPFRGKEVGAVLKTLYSIMTTFRFEPNIGLVCVSERLLYATASIVFDRETPGDDQRALRCYQRMFQILARKGYPPYRLGIQSMKNLRDLRPNSVKLLRRIKSIVDPNRILAPGRYE